jgi:hypothetical protein
MGFIQGCMCSYPAGWCRLRRINMKISPMMKKNVIARTEYRILPVRASMIPKLKVPPTVAIFSITS